MNDILRRAWMLALLGALVALPSCSSDASSEEGYEEPVPMETSGGELPPGDPVVREPEPDQPPVAPIRPSTPQEEAESFSRIQEERTLAEQREQVLVDTYLQAARVHLGKNDLDSAERATLQALNARPTDKDAIALMREIAVLRGEPVGTMQDVMNMLTERRRLVRQAQVHKANDHVLRATQAMDRGDFESARKELEQAKLIIDFDPYQTDFGGVEQRVPQMLAMVENRLGAIARQEGMERTEEAYRRVQAQEEALQAKQREKVRQTMIRAVEAYVREDFDNAEFLARRALDEQPGLPQAENLIENTRNARRSSWRQSYGARRSEEYKKWLEDARDLQIPNTDVLTWPSRGEWREIAGRRKRGDFVDQALDDTDAVKAMKAKLENERVNLDYGDEEVTFSQVIANIRAMYAMNIIVDREILLEKGEEPVAISLFDTTLGTAIRTLLGRLELEYVFKDDALIITSKEKALQASRPYPKPYDVQDITVSLPNFKAPNLTLRPGPAGESASRAILGEEGERTQDTTLDRLVELIRENVSPETWDTAGFSLTPASGRIVAVTIPSVHQELDRFLEDLRRFTKLTVHVEARFISLQRGFLSDFGIDFRGLGGQNPGQIALLDDVSNGAPYNASAAFDNGGPGLPAGQSLSPSSGFFYDNGNNGDFRGRTENIFNRSLGTILSSQGGAAVAFQILDDLQIGGLFRAVEKNVDTSLVNAPRLTIFNNQRANLTLVNQVSYVKDYDVEVAQTAFIADPLVDIVQDGLTLDVRPTVSHDRKFVTLEVQPTLATLVRPIRTFETNLSGLTVPVVIELPEIRYSQAATTVKVPDDGYVVIGGLKHVSTIDRRSETPILSSIPLLSFLFSRKGRSDEIRDLIIVIHVKVIDLAEQENRLVN
jgi:tetratricopeptide (TPR) repeat protein